jgi:hypothetical protein
VADIAAIDDHAIIFDVSFMEIGLWTLIDTCLGETPEGILSGR